MSDALMWSDIEKRRLAEYEGLSPEGKANQLPPRFDKPNYVLIPPDKNLEGVIKHYTNGWRYLRCDGNDYLVRDVAIDDESWGAIIRGNMVHIDLNEWTERTSPVATIETNEQGETIIRIDANPVYCSIRVAVENRRECVIEGWLIAATTIQPMIEIQPSVEYDPDGITLAFSISQLLSVTPAIPKGGQTTYVSGGPSLDNLTQLTEGFNAET